MRGQTPWVCGHTNTTLNPAMGEVGGDWGVVHRGEGLEERAGCVYGSMG